MSDDLPEERTVVPEGFVLVEVGAYAKSVAGRPHADVLPHDAGWSDGLPYGRVVRGDPHDDRRCAWERLYVLRPAPAAES